MSDSSDSDFVDGFARSNAFQYQRRNSGNDDDPRNLPGPSGIVPRRPLQDASVVKKVRKVTKRKPPQNQSQDATVNFRPEDFQLSEWFIQEMPQKTYFPQIGDDIVYFRQGHEIYLSVVKLKHPKYYVPDHPVPWSSLNLSPREYCRVTNVEFVLQPSRMCKLQLHLTRNHRFTDDSFTIYYHPVPEAMDFLVLRDVYNLSCLEDWRVGQRFRCALPNNTWRRGVIIAIVPLDQRFPESPFLRYRVRWDDGTVDRISSWDLVPNNHESTVNPRYTRIAVRREDLDVWQGVLHGCDWPLGDRDLFLETIAPQLELLLELLICEPFVDAQHERADPAYLATVAYPIDIGLILLRLDSGFYRRISSVHFDIVHILRNALHFYTPSHKFAKIARLSTDLLMRIIRDCRRNIPLKIMYRQSLDAVCYTDTETEENRPKVTRKKKLKRLKKSRSPSNHQIVLRSLRANSLTHSNDENRPPIIQELSNNEISQDLESVRHRAPLRPHQPRVPCKARDSGIRWNGKIMIVQVNLNGDNQLSTGLPQKHCKRKIHPTTVLQANGIDKIQLSDRRSQQRGSDTNRSVAILKANVNDENQPPTDRSQEYSSNSSRPLQILKANGKENQQCENVENQPSSSRHRECVSGNDSPQVVLRSSENNERQPSTSLQECGILGAPKSCRLQDRPSRLFIPPVIVEFNRTRAQQRARKRKYSRRRIVLKERNIKSNSSLPEVCMDFGSLVKDCQHQERVIGSPDVFNIDWKEQSINRSQERVRTPSPFLEIEGNQPSTSQAQMLCPSTAVLEIDRNQPSTSQHQESVRTPPLSLEIDQSQPSTSQPGPSSRWQKRRSKKDFYLEHNRATTDRRQQPQESVDRVTLVKKFPSKRPKETSSSDITTTSSSDSDMPLFFKYKSIPKRARLHKMSKMKGWRADCMRVLQTLWEDEDAAIFRESAMENHRRSVIEWVSLEYIMDFLKSGAYKDPNAVMDDVHTMLLHGRSLISAENADIARIIDKLSLLFDELIQPVLRKWDSLNAKGEEEEEQNEYRYREETESDLTVDEVTSSSSAMAESTPPQSPSQSVDGGLSNV